MNTIFIKNNNFLFFKLFLFSIIIFFIFLFLFDFFFSHNFYIFFFDEFFFFFFVFSIHLISFLILFIIYRLLLIIDEEGHLFFLDVDQLFVTPTVEDDFVYIEETAQNNNQDITWAQDFYFDFNYFFFDTLIIMIKNEFFLTVCIIIMYLCIGLFAFKLLKYFYFLFPMTVKQPIGYDQGFFDIDDFYVKKERNKESLETALFLDEEKQQRFHNSYAQDRSKQLDPNLYNDSLESNILLNFNRPSEWKLNNYLFMEKERFLNTERNLFLKYLLDEDITDEFVFFKLGYSWNNRMKMDTSLFFQQYFYNPLLRFVGEIFPKIIIQYFYSRKDQTKLFYNFVISIIYIPIGVFYIIYLPFYRIKNRNKKKIY